MIIKIIITQSNENLPSNFALIYWYIPVIFIQMLKMKIFLLAHLHTTYTNTEMDRNMLFPHFRSKYTYILKNGPKHANSPTSVQILRAENGPKHVRIPLLRSKYLEKKMDRNMRIPLLRSKYLEKKMDRNMRIPLLRSTYLEKYDGPRCAIYPISVQIQFELI